MPNKIAPRRSFTPNSVPIPASDISQAGELLVNWADGRLFTKDNSGNLVTLTVGGGGGGGGGSSGLSWSSVPASETASGSAGQMAYDSQYFYLCVASGRWVRIAFPMWDGSPIDGVITTEAGDVLVTEANEPILF